jgi:hypothetical protein
MGVGRATTDCMREVTTGSYRRFNLAIKLEINGLLKSYSVYFYNTIYTSDFFAQCVENI